MANDVNVKLDTAVMRAVARTLENQMNVIKNCYDSIRNDALRLRGTHWEGFSADTYYDSMIELCRDQQVSCKVTAGQIVGVLREYAKDLNFAASEYDRNEGRVTNKVEGLSINVFDV